MPRTDRTPRRRLDPQSRRAAILAAATEAFADRPYGDVTLASIAASAEASVPLVYRYFDGKEGLYTAVVREAVESLSAAHASAQERLAPGASARDRVRESITVYLDHVASHPDSWALPMRHPGSEPAEAIEIRLQARRDYVELLATLLAPNRSARHDFALWGYFGFLDAACLRWVDRGCPADDRWALVDAALGSLEGALGDWAA